MKKVLLLGALVSVFLVSCKKETGNNEQPKPAAKVTNFSELKVPSNFKFESTKKLNLSFDVDAQGVTQPFKVEVYDFLPSAGGGLIYSGYTSSSQLDAEITVPSLTNKLYLVKVDPTGASTTTEVAVNGNAVNYTFGKNKNSRKTTVVSTDCNTGCDQTVSSGWVNTSSNQVYCITGNINGLNDNGNNTTIRICGNITLNSTLSVKGQLEITEGSTLTVNGLQFNGNSGSMIVYPNATINVANTSNSSGDIVNYGTMNFDNEFNINGNGSLENNGVVNIGTNFNNSNDLENNASMVVDGNANLNGGSQNINNCSLIIGGQLIVNKEMHNYGYIEVTKDIHFNGGGTTIQHDGAMIWAKDVQNQETQINTSITGVGTTSLLKIDGDLRMNGGGSINGNMELCHTGGSFTNTGSINAPATLACGQVYIPTSSCNPTGNGAPQIVDTDGDGVADENDEFPNDAQRAATSYSPSSNTFATFAFEDLWPSQGDYDFNDIVLDIRQKLITNADGDVVDVEFRYMLRAIGGSFRNGFGIQFDELQPSAVSSVVRTGSYVSASNIAANGVETGVDKAVVMFFENGFNVLTSAGTATVNTDNSVGYVTPDTNVVTVTFGTPISVADAAEINPFIYIDQDRTVEVHMSGKQPTSKANTNLFGTGNDATNPSNGTYYVNENSLPWAIVVPQTWEYPQEKKDIVQSYLKFADWAQSGGQSFDTWYSNQPGYVDVTKIYTLD